MADFYHRTEVRDITGHCNSLLFNPDDFPEAIFLKRGSTCFVRYASKAYFSDLMTQVGAGCHPQSGCADLRSADSLVLVVGGGSCVGGGRGASPATCGRGLIAQVQQRVGGRGEQGKARE